MAAMMTKAGFRIQRTTRKTKPIRPRQDRPRGNRGGTNKMNRRWYDIRESRISCCSIWFIQYVGARLYRLTSAWSHLLQQSYRKQLMMRASDSFAEKGSPPAPALTEREFCSR